LTVFTTPIKTDEKEDTSWALSMAAAIPSGVIKIGEGVDVVTGGKVNMINSGIIDPVLVTKSALKNAVSVVTTIISADCVISNMRINESDK